MTIDLIIVGAGPAGLAAATEARSHGLSVLLLDEGAAPGGRIWQAIERRVPKDTDDVEAQRVIAAFRNSGTEYRPGATVWAIENGTDIYWSESGAARTATAQHILLATGTTERPMPFPGWTLPGVMTIGAAQIALKTSGLIPQGKVWLAGQGPLLLLYAIQAHRAGARIAGILDMTPENTWKQAIPALTLALGSLNLVAKGLAWKRELARAHIPTFPTKSLRAEGTESLASIVVQTPIGAMREKADTLLIHDGVIPSVALTRALGCAHEWDKSLRCWRPTLDAWGTTSIPTISVAGDGAGIGGWQSALLRGRLAAMRIAGKTENAAPIRRALDRALALRPFLNALYPPLTPAYDDATIICRCEEITAGRIREAVTLGCLGLNQLKAFTRCGMGPCQSRFCATTAAEIMAQSRAVPPQDIEPHRLRFPTKPLTLGELAALDADP